MSQASTKVRYAAKAISTTKMLSAYGFAAKMVGVTKNAIQNGGRLKLVSKMVAALFSAGNPCQETIREPC